jgi:hypothetical protein
MILRQEIEVVDALTALGVRRELLIEALLDGEAQRDACTPFDPSSAPGFVSYARTTRKLRELLVPLGWHSVDEDNLALVVSPNGDMAIAVSTGDEGTGVAYRPVKSKYPKGPATIAAVARNQLLLFGEPNPKREPVLDRKMWMLLRRRLNSTLYCELSLPQSVGEDERVEEWATRIILPAMNLEPSIAPPDSGDDIVIDISRRS